MKVGQKFYIDALLWRCLGLLVLTQVLAESLLYGVSDTPVSALVLSYAASTVLVGFLMVPLQEQDDAVSIAPLLSWSVIAAAAAALLIAFHAGSSVNPALLLTLTLGVFTLMLLLSSMMLFFALRMGSRRPAHRLVLGVSLLAASTPLWLGPVAEQLGAVPAMTSVIVAASPLSYLAAMSDYDFLRSAWFYQHTPLGGLRYAYLSPVLFTVLYLLLTMMLLLGRCLLLRRGHRHHTHHQPLINIRQEPTP